MVFSVITVCHNAVKTIERTIASVLGQTHPGLEYIVIDGDSTDGTRELLARHRRDIACVVSEPDNGIYDAMNKGIARAQGDVLFFLNADDVFVDSHVVADAVPVCRQWPADVMYGDIIHQNAVTGRTVHHRNNRVDWYHMLTGSITQQAIFYRADAFRTCGPFDVRYRIVGDYEWLLRAMFRHRLSMHYWPRTICRFDEGGVSGRQVSEETWAVHMAERRQVIEEYFGRFRYVMAHTTALRRLLFNRYNRFATAGILRGQFQINQL